MTNPWSGRFPATLPGVTARGRRAGTADDQLFVIVLRVIDLMTVMANALARAVSPWSFAIEEMLEICAIATIYTKS
jgi:hypothetical protein